MIPNTKLLANLQQVFGPLFDEIVQRAEQSMTLDQRIEACRRWPSAESLADLEDLERMQHERDTKDYGKPGTWYGCIRKWQAMTEEEALASFQTDWYENTHGIRKQKHNPEDLEAFYWFLHSRPLPPLTEQEETDMYDRRIKPACLNALFEQMHNGEFTGMFEDCFDYSHSEPWTICSDDFDKIREAFDGIRGDALESFLLSAVEVLAEQDIQTLEADNIDVLNGSESEVSNAG